MEQLTSEFYKDWKPFETVEMQEQQKKVISDSKIQAIQNTMLQKGREYKLPEVVTGSTFEPYTPPTPLVKIPETCVTKMLRENKTARKIAESEQEKVTKSPELAKFDISQMAYRKIPVTYRILKALRDKLPNSIGFWGRRDKIGAIGVALQVAGILLLVNTLFGQKKEK